MQPQREDPNERPKAAETRSVLGVRLSGIWRVAGSRPNTRGSITLNEWRIRRSLAVSGWSGYCSSGVTDTPRGLAAAAKIVTPCLAFHQTSDLTNWTGPFLRRFVTQRFPKLVQLGSGNKRIAFKARPWEFSLTVSCYLVLPSSLTPSTVTKVCNDEPSSGRSCIEGRNAFIISVSQRHCYWDLSNFARW